MNSLTDQNNTDPTNTDYLAQLTAPGAKFDRTKYQSDQEMYQAIAKGKVESDSFITTVNRTKDEQRQDNEALRQEYARLKADYETRASLEEVADQLTKFQRQQPVNNQPPVNDVRQPAFDPKQVETLVSQKLIEHETNKKQTENFNLVRSKLEERLGPNYQGTLTKQIQELGLTKEFVDDLARNHPNVLFKTLGLDQPAQQQPFQAPVRSQQSFVPTGEKKRTWAFYQQMRKDNPKLYHDPKTVVQMHNDAIALGEAFEDGDFKAL